MHELSITQEVVDAIAGRFPDRPVRRVRLEVGRLSGIVPEAMECCFEMVVAGTSLEGAELEFDRPVGTAACRTCGSAFETGEVLPLCDGCGSADVEVTGGRSLRIIEVETCVRPADATT
ncbi:hydrogenase maturation nickel metallochaperone HypA [Pseudonocardia nematodicida]|uniref:Hydrogenase maturation factor HypA n=1 Tax=Pseudonocardia nematodicida TaxID=1206997 RepID=A0ABV1K6F3_9PSEU